MLDLDRPIQTRDGRRARLVARDAAGGEPLVVLIHIPEGGGERETVHLYERSGLFHPEEDHPLDIVNAPAPPAVRYFNVYRSVRPGKLVLGSGFDDRSEADRAHSIDASERVACVRLEFVEGQFDD